MKHFSSAGVGLLLVLLTGGGCRKASVTQQPALPVNVVTVVEKEVNEWDEFTGRLDPVESVEIRPRVSGYITEIHFEAGAIVKKGDLLYVIDPRPYQADFDRAAAEVERMDAQLKLAEIELNRAKELRGKATISASEFDQKAATYQGAAAAKSSAEAAKNAAALNLEFTQIKSPIDGRVSDQRITVGNLVQPGAGPDSLLNDSSLGRSDLCQSRCRRERGAQICKAERGRETCERAHGEDSSVDPAGKRDGFSA